MVPKGYLAVYVGEGLKRFVIPMEDLGHQAFGILLTEAEEEFEFQQGVLKIPCQVAVFEKILKMMNKRRDAPNAFHLHDFRQRRRGEGERERKKKRKRAPTDRSKGRGEEQRG